MDLSRIALLALVVVVVALAMWVRSRPAKRGQPKAGAWAWYAAPRTYLITKAEAGFERELAGMLQRTGRDRWRIHVQVAMSAVFDGVAERRPKNWRGTAVPPWCLDYVLTDGDRIKGIIELNDRSHRQPKRRRRDENLHEGCARLGVPILFVEGERSGAEEWISQLE